MNQNAIIAVLILRNIITHDEGQAIVDHIHDKPQSTVLADAINDIKPLLIPVEALMPQLGPVGPEQRQEEIAARSAAAVAPPPDLQESKPEEPKVTEPAKTETEPEADKQTETDKSAKDTSVKKADAKPAKK